MYRTRKCATSRLIQCVVSAGLILLCPYVRCIESGQLSVCEFRYSGGKHDGRVQGKRMLLIGRIIQRRTDSLLYHHTL
jgi:hypothetical protein